MWLNVTAWQPHQLTPSSSKLKKKQLGLLTARPQYLASQAISFLLASWYQDGGKTLLISQLWQILKAVLHCSHPSSALPRLIKAKDTIRSDNSIVFICNTFARYWKNKLVQGTNKRKKFIYICLYNKCTCEKCRAIKAHTESGIMQHK